MTEEQFRVLSAAQDFVSDLFTSKVDKGIHFHTLQHTQEVLAGCERMADYYHLEDEDRFALMIAAWFHDTGYSGGKALGHENVSIELATKFLNEHKVSQQVINKVVGCINATRLPQTPHTLIEQIIADADLFHLGTSDFKEKNKLLREELNDFGNLGLSKKDWRTKNIEFLSKHTYFTSYAKEQLDPLKQVYLHELNKKAGIDEKTEKKQAKDPKSSKDPKPAFVIKNEKPKDKGLTADEQKKVD
jgi:predicted metal-dependent HD superfamily phosphohydrolase